jgi:hypothetical protein
MKKYLLISLSLFILVSCTKDISDLNQERKAAANVPAATLFSNGVRELADELTTPNVNRNVLRLTVQHWATTTYTDEPQYDFTTRNIPQTWWQTLYRDVLIDLQEAKRLIPMNTTLPEGVKANQTAIADIMQVYTFSILVNTFGDVPYTEALDYNNLFPKYDDAKTIYDDLFKRLDEDIAALDPASAGFPAAADLVYGGSVAKWIKFANALKIRLAMTIADADEAKAKAAVEQADANAFTSATDNALILYAPGTPNTNPLWEDLIQSKRQDFIAANALVETMKSLNDPRLSTYYKPNESGQYVGGTVGGQNAYPLFAKPGTKLEDPELPGVLLSYSEIEFYRAEAKERGFSIAGTAAEHYNNAIKASIIYWGGTNAQADAYLAQPGVAYNTAPGNYKQKIGTQKWIALYNRPFEAWTEVRRLDYPKLAPPAGAKSGFPNRLTYPTNEQTLNPESYTAAAGKIGSDKVEAKVFWDKN